MIFEILAASTMTELPESLLVAEYCCGFEGTRANISERCRSLHDDVLDWKKLALRRV